MIVEPGDTDMMSLHSRNNPPIPHPTGAPAISDAIPLPGTPDVRTLTPRTCHTGSDCETFDTTHHTVLGAFRDFWNANGGLAVFGYPLTEEFTVTDSVTSRPIAIQVFERAIFEFHPEIDGGAILLERLGAEVWDYYRDNTLAHPEWFVTVPDAASDAPYLPATP